jgi:hypothetical protein
MEITRNYLQRHPQPTAAPPKLNGPVASNHLGETFVCHKKKREPGQNCASKYANHHVPYYNSGSFDYNCPNCGAILLKSEFKLLKSGRWAKCCAYGDIDTNQMKADYKVR